MCLVRAHVHAQQVLCIYTLRQMCWLLDTTTQLIPGPLVCDVFTQRSTWYGIQNQCNFCRRLCIVSHTNLICWQFADHRHSTCTVNGMHAAWDCFLQQADKEPWFKTSNFTWRQYSEQSDPTDSDSIEVTPKKNTNTVFWKQVSSSESPLSKDRFQMLC